MTEVAEWFSVITGVIAMVALLGSIPLIAKSVVGLRLGFTKGQIVRALVRGGPPRKSHFGARRASWRQIRKIISGCEYTAADELQWLTDVAGSPTSFAFSTQSRSSFRNLSGLYRRYATALQVRTFLFGGSQPVLEKVSSVARAVAQILETNANNYPIDVTGESSARSSVSEVRTNYASLRPDVDPTIPSRIYLEQFELRGKAVAHDLHVSWHKEDSRRPEEDPVSTGHAREYNGLLPRLLSRRFERDLSNGNYRLHIDLGETFYNDHKKRSRPKILDSELSSIATEALLTMCVLPLTSDGYFLIAERGDIGFYPHCWGPGAGGNLEIPRLGSGVDDIDSNGIISPFRAIARETQEELGITLGTHQLQTLGLARVANCEEFGTWLLTTVAATGLTVAELARSTYASDAVAGRWEVGKYLAAVQVPRDRESAEILLSWTLRNDRAMPHLTASVVRMVSQISDLQVDLGSIKPRASDTGDLPEGAIRFRFGQDLELEVASAPRRSGPVESLFRRTVQFLFPSSNILSLR